MLPIYLILARKESKAEGRLKRELLQIYDGIGRGEGRLGTEDCHRIKGLAFSES